MHGWRKSPFQEGKRYMPRKSFKGVYDSFEEKEILLYQRESYSAYDQIAIYIFRDKAGHLKRWTLHDDLSLESWHQFFQPVSWLSFVLLKLKG